MFDKLLEEDERVIELMAEREARGEVRGQMKTLITVIETRFPTFADEARNKLLRVKQPEKLDTLAQLVVTAPDENALRWVLDSMVA